MLLSRWQLFEAGAQQQAPLYNLYSHEMPQSQPYERACYPCLPTLPAQPN